MSSKKLNVVLYAICCILALYGLIILIRKMMLASDAERKSKKELGMKFYIEPFRQKSAKQEYDECIGRVNERCKGPRCHDFYMKCKSQYKLYCEDNPDDLDCKSFKEIEEREKEEMEKIKKIIEEKKKKWF